MRNNSFVFTFEVDAFKYLPDTFSNFKQNFQILQRHWKDVNKLFWFNNLILNIKLIFFPSHPVWLLFIDIDRETLTGDIFLSSSFRVISIFFKIIGAKLLLISAFRSSVCTMS